jgi:TetR/AcrR family transcriptional repressor of nem operon
MKYPDDHKAKTRDRVLREASKAIRVEGADRMSIAAVMKAAGMTVGGFYAHFSSKDDLIAETVNFMFVERYSTFFAHIGEPDPREALTRFVEFYLSMRHRDSASGGCPIPALAGQAPSLPIAARDRFLLGVERLTQSVADCLDAMDVVGPREVASAAMAEMVGTIILARLSRSEEEAEAMLETTLHSVKAKLGLLVDC